MSSYLAAGGGTSPYSLYDGNGGRVRAQGESMVTSFVFSWADCCRAVFGGRVLGNVLFTAGFPRTVWQGWVELEGLSKDCYANYL